MVWMVAIIGQSSANICHLHHEKSKIDISVEFLSSLFIIAALADLKGAPPPDTAQKILNFSENLAISYVGAPNWRAGAASGLLTLVETKYKSEIFLDFFVAV